MNKSYAKSSRTSANITPLEDGLWQVDVGGICAGFVIIDGEVVRCAPILRRSFPFWVKFAKRVLVPDNNRSHQRYGADNNMEQQETQPQSTTLDIKFDVKEADVTRPVLQGGTYDCTIGFARQEPSRKKGIPTLTVGYRTAQLVTDTQGRPVNPGFTVMQRVILKPTGDLTQKMIDDRVKQIHFAACGEGHFDGNTAQWLGKKVRCRVQLREPHIDETTGEEYPESNEINRVLSAAK
jgi:hypothetical protein